MCFCRAISVPQCVANLLTKNIQVFGTDDRKISKLEKEIKEIDVELEVNYDKTVADPEFFDQYQAKKKSLSALMEDWEDIQLQFEEYNE